MFTDRKTYIDNFIRRADVEGVVFDALWVSRAMRVVPQAEIDPDKVAAYADRLEQALQGQDTTPPRVIVADYGDSVLVIDGHHRIAAAHQKNMVALAWICDGAAYDDLSCRLGSDAADRAIIAALPAY